MKRLLDIAGALCGLAVTGPFMALAALLVWLQDFHSPLYIPWRVARGGGRFRMFKLRSMVIRADATGVSSTAGDDRRITRLGHVIRRFKLDELPQLFNVLIGDMSLVGPRPNVESEVRAYTPQERHLLDARPGITDMASIAFADESDVLRGSADPDLAYNQLIRPWKSRLGLLYVSHASVGLDLQLLGLTALTLVNRRSALDRLEKLVASLGAAPEVCAAAGRKGTLVPHPPPGMSQVVGVDLGAAKAP